MDQQDPADLLVLKDRPVLALQILQQVQGVREVPQGPGARPAPGILTLRDSRVILEILTLPEVQRTRDFLEILEVPAVLVVQGYLQLREGPPDLWPLVNLFQR